MVSKSFLCLQHGGETPVPTVRPLERLAFPCSLCWAPCVARTRVSVVKGHSGHAWTTGPSGSVALPSHPSPGLRDEEAALAQSVTLAPNRPTLASAQLTGFFGTLDSVLKYRATVMQAFKDMNRFTVNETVLSTKDVLILLHKWSLLERDAKLQEDLRAAIEKYQVKELLSECQDPTVWCSPNCAHFPHRAADTSPL